MSPSAPALGILALVTLAGCRQHAESSDGGTSKSAAPVSAPPDAGPKKLPEDPVKAREATEQWHEHLVEEERERRLRYDRLRAKKHEAVFGSIEKVRARYDASKTKGQVSAARASVRPLIDDIKKKIEDIDPDRQSSNLLEDYDAILKCLDERYASALVASFGDDAQSIAELRAELDRHVARARELLKRAEREHE